jgi:hypothetical protein
MQILNELTTSLSKEEVRYFKLFLSKYTTGDARKDEGLFDYMRKAADNYSDDVAMGKLYADGNTSAFYRLKNRVISNLSKSLVLQYIDEDDNIAYQYLQMAKFCLGKRLFQPALYYLKRAEKQSATIENFELLDIIYGEYIRLSREVSGIDPESYIEKRRTNSERLSELRRIDDIVSVVSHKLKLGQNFSAGQEPVVKLLEKITKTYSANNPAVESSPRLMVGMFRAVTQILLQKHDYLALEQYVADAEIKFTGMQLFAKGYKEMYLQMLVYRINALLKMRNFDKAKQLAKTLQAALTGGSGGPGLSYTNFFNKYIFFYYNAMVNIYSETDIDKAIKEIEFMQTQTNLKKLDFYALFVPLNLAILWYGKENYRQSVKYFNELYQTDGYAKSAADLQLKIAVAELIVRFEMADFDYLQYRIAQVRKTFKEQLKQANYTREKEFLAIVSDLTETPLLKSNKKLMARIEAFIKTPEAADGQVISYTQWLAAKSGLSVGA